VLPGIEEDSMSLNDGGDPIRLSKAPVPKPNILRGKWLFPGRGPGLSVGDRTTLRAGLITYHDVEVVEVIGGDPAILILPETVVTWDVAPNPN
jgi:hypothetical protein